jgi:hypothetical protein
VPDLDAVRKRALDVAKDILDDGEAQGDDRIEWRFDIEDSADRTVLTMPFSAAAPTNASLDTKNKKAR